MIYVTKAELDALAATANARLLPLVNAAIAADVTTWYGYDYTANFYSKFILGLPGTSGCQLVQPQPAYSFDAVTGPNLVPSGATYDSSGNYPLPSAIAQAADYNLKLGANDLWMKQTLGASSNIIADTVNNFYLVAGMTMVFKGTPNQPVTAQLSVSGVNYLMEWNRIRGDIMALFLGIGGQSQYGNSGTFPGGQGLFLNPSLVNSGPWVVGINDPDIYPATQFNNLYRGVLQGTPPVFPFVNGFSIFKQVAFTAAPIPSGLAIDSALRVVLSNWNGAATAYALTGTATLKTTIYLAFTCTITPSLSDFVITTTGLGSPTYSLVADPANGANAYLLIRTGSTSGVASGSISFAPTIEVGSNLIPGGSTYGGSDYKTFTLMGDFSGWDGVADHFWGSGSTPGTAWDFVHGNRADEPSGIVSADATQITFRNEYGADNDPVTCQLRRTNERYYTLGNSVLVADMVFSTASTTENVAGLHPTAQPQAISCTDVPATAKFTLNGVIAEYVWILSDPTVKGIWSALTLPTPAKNTFIDQDIPPYINNVSSATDAAGNPEYIAIAAGSGLLVSQTGLPYDTPNATTMRQTAPPVAIGFEPGRYAENTINVNPLTPGVTTRSARWCARRDTDYFPYDFGFNAFFLPSTPDTYYRITLQPGQVNHQYPPWLANVTVPPLATGIKIALMKPGTQPGWYYDPASRTSKFQYGEPVGTSLTILVKASALPTLTTYDFATTNNAVTMPTDGNGTAASFANVLAASGFDFGVYYPPGPSDAPPLPPVTFDVYVEIQYGPIQRTYIPKCAECFSYSLQGRPGALAALNILNWGAGSYQPKPIPQSGYCIFTLRATRLPVDNGFGIAVTPPTGAALTITIGQNKWDSGANTLTFTPLLESDGVTPWTITIPATAGDSGDVSVFLPVLAGNEVVYQCSEQIKLEAWANFQPLFWNQMFAIGQAPFNDSRTDCQPSALFFQYALAFVNEFNIKGVGWPQRGPFHDPTTGDAIPGQSISPVVVFPLFRELFTDVQGIVNALPAIGDGSGSGGAGGTGGGVGNPSAGGAGGTQGGAGGGGEGMI